jgi:hypothetical protein
VKRRLVPRVGRETIRVLLLHYDLKPSREKNVGAWSNSMRSTSPKWRMFWRRMNGHTIPRSRLCVWMRTRSRCMPMFVLPHRRSRVAKPDRTTNTSDAARPTFSCAVEPKAVRHFMYPTPDRSAFEFANVVFDLAMRYPKAETIHLVMDNLNIHRRKPLTNLLGEDASGEVWNRFTVHLHSNSRKLAESG